MGSIIIISVVVFLAIVLALVGMLLYAKAKLTPSGPVKITINGEKEITVNAGSTLLSTLANEKIFLPSACGGGGTCAMCKCQVIEGGGSILPTETGLLYPQTGSRQLAPRMPGESTRQHEHSDSGRSVRN